MPQIIVEVSTQGESTVMAQGVTGSGCKALTEAIERAIGKTTQDRPTAEMFTQQAQHAKASA